MRDAVPTLEARSLHNMEMRAPLPHVYPLTPNPVFIPTTPVSRFEHAQNVTLARILTTCLELTSLQGPSYATKGAAPAAAVVEGAPAQELELGRYVNLWLGLQNSVCALMDSTAADGVDSQGIRQVLEKKEGLFRKNMMGKRVNFAAR